MPGSERDRGGAEADEAGGARHPLRHACQGVRGHRRVTGVVPAKTRHREISVPASMARNRRSTAGDAAHIASHFFGKRPNHGGYRRPGPEACQDSTVLLSSTVRRDPGRSMRKIFLQCWRKLARNYAELFTSLVPPAYALTHACEQYPFPRCCRTGTRCGACPRASRPCGEK